MQKVLKLKTLVENKRNVKEVIFTDNKMIASNSDIVFYKKDNGDTNIELLINGETLWVSQKTMAEIFDIDRSVITKHLKNIFNDGELDKNQVCAKFAHTANDGKKYNTEFYNLDAIISVGYRVNSKKATEFMGNKNIKFIYDKRICFR